MIERRGLRWYWQFYSSAYGYADGYAWTHRGAKRAMSKAAGFFLLESD